MRILTVPNWSFGRDQTLLRQFRDILDSSDVDVHYCESDIDHNRTVTAFTGEADVVTSTLLTMAEVAFGCIDLNRHTGVHPRIGALDVCPFVLVPGHEYLEAALDVASDFGETLSINFDLPVYLYEKSERGRHEADLPSLRKGGFGALLDRDLKPDFGPARVHPQLGVSVVGVRDFLIAMNANLETEEVAVARTLAAQIRNLRQAGDERFLGVRALGFPLASLGMTQVSMNLTLPDLVSPDPIIEWIREEGLRRGVAMAETELIGVIRMRDRLGATRLPIRPQQVVDA